MKEQILNAANPVREAALAYIEKFTISEWNQGIHAGFIVWLAVELGLLDPKVAAHKAFAAMLGSYGLAGNASQFGQCLAKEPGKHVLGGLLAKAGASSLEAFLAGLAPKE